jgi:cytochrome c oxidase assembly protein subunit 16
MPTFGSKKFRTSSYNNTLPARYRAALAKHPFALFGLPFVGTMLLGSFFLTPATALRYERHDRKVKTMTEEEKLGIGKDRRRIDMKEEYYVSYLRPAMTIIAGNFAGECIADVGGTTETCSQGSGQLGAEASQEIAW